MRTRATPPCDAHIILGWIEQSSSRRNLENSAAKIVSRRPARPEPWRRNRRSGGFYRPQTVYFVPGVPQPETNTIIRAIKNIIAVYSKDGVLKRLITFFMGIRWG